MRGERGFSVASDTEARQRDLELRPRSRPGDVFEVAPGLLVVQHAGGGKANQYFLRGFDADHGTDLALSLDGVPFNNVSHGHGQGYADPNFIIPELVERVEVHEGPYHAEDGDFATAGAVNLRYLQRVPASSLTLQGGMYGQGRLLGIARTEQGTLRGYLAAELSHNDGPFVIPLDYNRTNVVGRWTWAPSDRAELTLTAMAYNGAWRASGQVPSRLTDDPSSGFSRFDAVDPSEGGQSERRALSLEGRRALGPGASVEALLYAVQYRFSLFSNFTFFAEDPERGDMIEQTDARTTVGLRGAWRAQHQAGAWRFRTSAGVQARADDIDNALYTAPGRARDETRARATVRQSALGVFAEEQVLPTRWLRLIAGVRADLFNFAVEDTRAERAMDDRSGVRSAGIVSPKATVVLAPSRALELYANFGSGFHSNDARGVVLRGTPVTPLARGLGYELGLRARVRDRLDLAISAWGLDLQSELVWVGDAGETDPRGPTRRVGVTAETRWAITRWLRADVDLSVVRARYTEAPAGQDAIALAPTLMVSAGIAGRHPSGVFGSLRLRAVGDRPADPAWRQVAQGFAVFSAQAGYRRGWWEVAVQAENLLDTPWREAQFGFASRLRSECTTPGAPRCDAPADGQRFGTVTDVHFTPGVPFTASLRLTLFLS